MARPVDQDLWDQWRKRLERQRQSGLSIAEFCRREQVSPPAFYAWRRKFLASEPVGHVSRKMDATSRSGRRAAGVTRRRASRRTLVTPAALTARADFLQLPVTVVRPSPWIELVLADGTIVRVPQQNLAALVTLLRVLRGEHGDVSMAEAGHA